MNMGHVCFILLLFSVFNLIEAEVLLLRSQENNSRVELSCYYNGPQTESVGLAWILPNATNYSIPETHERWRHSSRSGLIRGHFEYYGHIWQSTTSLMVKPNIYPPVFDERWNDFETLFTSGVDGDFTPAILFNTDRLHFSLLAQGNAHIALHTGLRPFDSSTYWITLGQSGLSAENSFLRKCRQGLNRTLIPQDCITFRSFNKDQYILENGTNWVHFTIELKYIGRASLQIQLFKLNPQRLLMSWTDTIVTRNLRYISFSTKSNSGKWKLHNYRIVVHNGLGDGDGFNIFNIAENWMCCLQFYYFLRPSLGTVWVKSKNNLQAIQLDVTNGSWVSFKVNMLMQPPVDHIHFLPPYGEKIRASAPVFALSEPFRICGDNEFFVSRIVTTPANLSNAKCVNIKTQDYAVLGDSVSQEQEEPVCPANRFSKSCNITCGRVVGDMTCSGKVLCDKDKCFCASGYKPTESLNTTCIKNIPSDIAPIPITPNATEQEVDSNEDESVDTYLGEEVPYEDYESLNNLQHKYAECKGKNSTLIVFCVLLALVLVFGALAAMHVHFKQSNHRFINSLVMRWNGDERLIPTL